MENKRFYSLDVLKIAATIFIVFHHFQQVTGAFYKNQINFYNGKFYFGYMVELFFVLSGFFMVNYIERIKNGLSFKKFYLRRMQRLLPLTAIGAISYEVLLYIYQTLYKHTWFDIKLNVWGIITDSLGIQDGWSFSNPSVNNPTWYISVLFLCYAIFYIITYVSKKLKVSSKYFYLAMIFLGCGIQTYNINLPFLNSSTCRGFYAFFAGLLLATYLQNRKIKIQELLISAVSIITIIGGIVFCYDYVSSNINYLLTFVLFPAIIIVMSTDVAKKCFSHPIWGKWAEISFDVYIWHNPMFIAMYILIKVFSIKVNFTNVLDMYIYCLIAEIIGIISYLLIEKPLKKYIQQH